MDSTANHYPNICFSFTLLTDMQLLVVIQAKYFVLYIYSIGFMNRFLPT